MEGKKKYFALVLFLFLGLMIFTFANPVEEEKEFVDGDTEQSEKVNNKETDTTKDETTDEDDADEVQTNVLNNVTNQNTNNNNNTQNRVDDSLARAEAAVQLAEGTYTQEDVDAARELVNNVTDTTEKGKLEDRLTEVEAGIAVLALLEELETQVDEAENKTDMTTATTFRDTNEIAEKIEALTNEEVAEVLQTRLNTVSKLLDDNAAPTVNVEAKGYQTNVTIEATDEAGNPFTLFLTRNNGTEEEIENNTATTSEGIYILRMVDDAFNEATVRFVVDGTDPVLKGLTNGGHYEKVLIDVEDLSEVTIKVTNMDTNTTTTVENGTELTVEATYKIEVTDEAGNTTTYWVAVDKTAPTISGVTNNSIVNKSENAYIRDKFLTLVKVTIKYPNGEEKVEEFTRADFTVGARNENFEYKYRATKEGTYTIYAEDKYGNNYSETFTIDRTAAKLVSANMYSNGDKYTEVINDKEHQVYYTTNGDTITAYIRVDEQLKAEPTITLTVGDKSYTATNVTEAFHKPEDKEAGIYRYQATVKVDEFNPVDGEVQLTVTNIYDKAGNATANVTKVTNRNIVKIDRTAAARVYSTIRSKAKEVVHENGNDRDYYHKNGTEFEYAISFNELLANVPTVTIAGRKIAMELNEEVLNKENKFLYEGTFKIAENEAELTEGTLEIKVTDVKDLAGNETTLADQTKTSNGRRVIYDRTAATRMSADFYVNGLTQVGKTFYTQYGKKLTVNVTTNEQLGQVPTFTLHNNGKDYVIEGAIYRGLNDKGYHLYQASYELTKESGMTDGEITFTVSNIADIAGNTTNNVTEATNGRKVVLDNVLSVDKLAIRGKNGQWKDKEYIQYANTGTTIYVDARFKEELVATPVVKLNDKVELTKATKKESNGIWIYSYSYKLKENDGLVDGTIQVKVTNIKDIAGNTTELTNANMTLESQSEVVVDRTLPTYRFTKAGSSLAVDEITPIVKDGVFYFNQPVRVTLSDSVNLRLHGINTYSDDKNAKRTGWLKDIKEDGLYTAVAVDAAGNRLEFKFVVDTTAPKIKLAGTEGRSSNELRVESGTIVTLEDVIAHVTDNIDGEYTIEPYKADLLISNVASENIYNYDFSNGFDTRYIGRYNIYYKTKDTAGNETTATMLLVMTDTTEATIELPGQEGADKNQYRILKDSYIEINYIAAKFNDLVDGEGEILPKEIWKFYPSAMNTAAHKYTLLENEVDRNGDGVKEIEKYFDTSVVGINYRVTYEYVDKAGNKTSKNMLLIVDAPYEPEIVNNEINVNSNLTLNDKPFYNDKERTEPLTINGNGKTIIQEIDTTYKYTWDITGTRPMQSNMFTSANNSLVTVNDLNFAGEIYSITLGHYRSSNQGGFTTVLNNVNVINTKVASFSGGLSPAMSIYGKATLNNVNVYGTTLSDLDTSPKWPVYDVIMVNNTNTTINGGKIGTIFTWPKAYLEINNAEIGTIDTQIEYRSDYTKAGLVIGENTKVDKIIIKENKAVVTIKSTAEVGTLDLCAQDITEMKLNFESGAKIDKIILKDGSSCKEMIFDEWYKSVYPITVNSVDEFKTALSEGYRNIIVAKTLDIVGNQILSATKQTKVTTVDKITMFNIAAGQSLTLENIILDGENKYKVDVTKAAEMHNDPFNHFGEYPTEQTRIYAATPLIKSNGTLTLGTGTVIRNYAHQPVSPQYGGPAVSVTGGSVVINGLEFTNNVSQLLTASNATVTINNINVHDTWATGNKAGLIEINTGATMDVNNGTFKNNMMSMRSYGLFIANAGTINMKGGVYENNYSTRNGGNTAGSLFGVETTGKIYMTGGTVQNNIGYRAGSFATRWANEGSIIELNGGTIKNNTTRSADFKNAGIFVQSDVKIGTNMIIEEKVVLRGATAVLENNGKIVGDVELVNNVETFNNNGTVTGNIIIPE